VRVPTRSSHKKYSSIKKSEKAQKAEGKIKRRMSSWSDCVPLQGENCAGKLALKVRIPHTLWKYKAAGGEKGRVYAAGGDKK